MAVDQRIALAYGPMGHYARQERGPEWSSSASVSSLSLLSLSSLGSESIPDFSTLPTSDTIPTGITLSSTFEAPISSSDTPSPSLVSSQAQLTTQTFTTSTILPVTITLASSTIISSTVSLVESTSTGIISRQPSPTATMQSALSVDGSICAGQGLDASAQGVIATTVIATLVGLIIWLIFAVIRPRFPQIYALREWFINPDIRPKHLGSGLFAFLSPNVPMVPDMPEDTSDMGESPAEDARLFPSDEELSQRTLWVAFLIALGWTVLGLLAALPLYMVSTPCVADSFPKATYGGRTSTLADLSLLRLLKLIDDNTITTSSNPSTGMAKRAIINGSDEKPKAKTRLIILTVFVIVLGVLPALFKIWREFNAVVAYRKRWLEIKCGSVEMGWLSLARAPGLKGRSEGRIKELLLKGGLTSGFEQSRTQRGGRMVGSTPAVSRVEGRQGDDNEEVAQPDVDVQGLFTVTETGRLADLLQERDQVLSQLEEAEAQYIAGFRTSTPSSSQVEFNQDELESPSRAGIRIGRPRVLGGTRKRQDSGTDPHAPTSYIAPSSYYKLRGIQGGTGSGRTSMQDPNPSGEPFPSRSQAGTPHGENEGRTPYHLRPHDQAPFVRPLSGQHDALGQIYHTITDSRTRLKALNADIADAQQDCFNDIAEGVRLKGWLLVGKGIRFIPGVTMIEGRSKEDVRWQELQHQTGMLGGVTYATIVLVVAVCLAAALAAVSGLALAGAPEVANYLPFLSSLSDNNNLGSGVATTFAPAVAASVFIFIALVCMHYATRHSGVVSISQMRLLQFKATFGVLVFICATWLIAAGGLLFGMKTIANERDEAKTVSEGAIYAAILLMLIIITLAIISPGLLLLQPFRLFRVWRAERRAITPRQRFRALYPKPYNPSFALGCCVLGVVFACTFSFIFPLICLPVVLLLILTLVAHRYLVGYVISRASVGQTGGLLHLWVLKRFGTLLALQPLLLGLILLSRRLWGLAGVLLGSALIIIVGVEVYASHKMRLPGAGSLSPITRESLQNFSKITYSPSVPQKEEEGASLVSSAPRQTRRPRTSIASVLDMMSLTLAVMPSAARTRGPVPLATEDIDDRVSTERAARTRPGAPPHLPFVDRAEETAGMMYPPELLAPQPIIWLPNDSAGIARSEAYDLQRFHDFEVTLDAVHDDHKGFDIKSHRRRASSTHQDTPRRDSLI